MKPIGSLMRMLLVAFAAALVVGCGGGGDADQTGGSGTPPVTPPANPGTVDPRLLLSTTEVSAQASMADTPPIVSVTLQIQNLTASSDIYIGGSYSTGGIGTIALVANGFGGANMSITFRSPDTLAAGTYQDTITVKACTESPCVTQIGGSPQTITVTYIVTRSTVAMNLSGTSVSVTADNATHAAITDRSINLAISNPSARQWLRATVAGSVVREANFAYSAPLSTQATLVMSLRAPSSLGAGTYTDSVKVELCLNPECSLQAIGSPATVAVTYTITGSPLPTTRISWSTFPGAGFPLTTTETRSPTIQLLVSSSDLPSPPIYMRHGASTTGLIQGVVMRRIVSGFDSGQVDVSLKPPSTLGSGNFTDSMDFEACFDEACATPVPNSKYTLAVNILVTATEGVEYTRRVLQMNGATEVAWSPTNQSLYVVTNTLADHRITQVDPVAMATGAVAALPPEYPNTTLRNMMVTPDGSYLYLGSFSAYLYRLKLSTLQLDLAIPLGSSPNQFTVRDLAAVPDQPRSIIVSGSNAGVYVYDDAVVRPVNVAPDLNPRPMTPTWVIPSVTPGLFMAQSSSIYSTIPTTMDLLTLDANGISKTSSTPTAYPFGFAKPQRSGTKLYTGRTIADAASGAILGTLPGLITHYESLVDETHGRIFVWSNVSNRSMVVSYDLNTLKLLAYADVGTSPSVSLGDAARMMALWGSDGLALVNGNQLILLSGAFFSTYGGEPR